MYSSTETFELDGPWALEGGYISRKGLIQPGVLPHLRLLKLTATYAMYQGPGLSVGPALAYSSTQWALEDPLGHSHERMTYTGFGFGGFVTAEIGGATVRATYVANPSVAVEITFPGGFPAEGTGVGERFSLRTKLPVAARLAVVAGYHAATHVHVEKEDLTQKGSGFDIGVAYTF